MGDGVSNWFQSLHAEMEGRRARGLFGPGPVVQYYYSIIAWQGLPRRADRFRRM